MSCCPAASREDLAGARHSFHAAARGQERPAYFCGLGLVELRLGMTRKAIKHLRRGRELMVALEPTHDSKAALRNTDLALALAYKKRAREEWSHKAARRGVESVENALLVAPAGTCERILRDQLVLLDQRLEPSTRTFGLRALPGAASYNANLESD